MNKADLDEFINKVREQSDIYSVVSRYLPLTMKNGRYWAACPFHNEKTPSFSVNSEKGVFYCFGCHVGGNVFKFLSLIENITYFDAIKLQAERLGIPIPSKKQKSPEELKRVQETKNLLKACEFANEFYHNRLVKTPAGERGREYLKSRGISPEVIETFQLGIAPAAWDDLINEMTKRGFDIDKLIAAGLILRNKSGTGFYDRFRDRIIIPIHDIYGRVVAFGGRIFNPDDKDSPKYLNSPETEIFKKGQLLFGLDKAHQEISKTNTAIVVEGYMDAISLVSAGVKNVVATLGTAFTENHAKLLSRYARKVILCYDSDEAGQRATLRALPIIKDAGLVAAVAEIPDGKDPDDFIRKHGKEAFDNLLKNSKSFIDYTMDYFMEKEDHSTSEGKLQILEEILPLIVSTKNFVLEHDYRKRIATDLLIDENVIVAELNKHRKRLRDVKKFPSNMINVRPMINERMLIDTQAVQKAGGKILQTIWNENDMLGYVDALVPKEAFADIHQEIIDYMQRCLDMDRHPDDISAAAELSDAANSEIIRILSVIDEDRGIQDLRAFNDAIKKIRLAVFENKYTRLLNEAKKYVMDDDDKYNELIRESFSVREHIDELREELSHSDE